MHEIKKCKEIYINRRQIIKMMKDCPSCDSPYSVLNPQALSCYSVRVSSAGLICVSDIQGGYRTYCIVKTHVKNWQFYLDMYLCLSDNLT